MITSLAQLLIKLLRRKRFGTEIKLEDITPELLTQYKLKMSITDYRKWLRRHCIIFGGSLLERKERSWSIPALYIEKIKILEKELEATEISLGIRVEGKRVSDELLNYKKIV